MIGDWEIQCDGDRVWLFGPGECEIVLDNFDPSRIIVFEKLVEELGMEEPEGFFTQKVIRSWVYPMGFGVVLRVASFRDTVRPAQRARHYLELKSDNCEVSWMVREDFAEAMHALGR